MTGLPDRACESLTDATQLIRLAERYIGAYRERNLEAMLALIDENVVSYPAWSCWARYMAGGRRSARERWWPGSATV
jgi:hypothetical protein